jgi:transcriptional regulatory protein RtcR
MGPTHGQAPCQPRPQVEVSFPITPIEMDSMKTVVISLLGTVLDMRGAGPKRWDKWRPTLSLCRHEELLVDRMELLFQPRFQRLADQISDDIRLVSPDTQVRHHLVELGDPWAFESVYAALHDFSRQYPFDRDHEDYLIHITTGTHVAQICLYLLTEAHYLPGRLIQSSPPPRGDDSPGTYQIIDLDLSRYDQIASRFSREHQEGLAHLKGGIETRNGAFNQMITQLERVSIAATEPILLIGPTGAGKSQLARRVYGLKRQRGQVSGRLVEVNCATLRGDNAMSALFGHRKGAFTGAIVGRNGLLMEADGGVLFLDEVGELGLDEQAMLLRAIEDKCFMPLGADREVSSAFQLIAGTNRDLFEQVRLGRFREDLLARINLWTYRLPCLRERLEDLEPNLDYELERFAQRKGVRVSFNKEAREQYLRFALGDEAHWSANFRDLNASVTRMATLAAGGRITAEGVAEEIARLREAWVASGPGADRGPDRDPRALTARFVDPAIHERLDLIEHCRLAAVAEVCSTAPSLAEAGRRLFDRSREHKRSTNDSHRLRQLLAKYGTDFQRLRAALADPP